MKKANKFLTCIFVAVMLLVVTACGGGEKDEWDGAQILDNTLCQTASVKSGIVNPPTVVCDMSTKAAYEQVTSGEQKPSNVILRLNDKFNVVDANGKMLCSFSSLYTKTLKGKIIPVIYLKNEDDAKRAIKLFKERYDLLDAAVMSNNAALVKSVRSVWPKVRGIAEFAELNDIHDAVALSTENLAMVAVIPQSAATADNVFYIQSRFKTVWVRVDGKDPSDLRKAIDSGAYGIVSPDVDSVADALGAYVEPTYLRKPFIVAHRGLPKTHNENSVAGCRAAVEAGATHVEIDGYLTLDGRIAIMHDHTLDRTSDGNGVVEEYKIDQLQNFNLDLFEPREPIPSLDDILQEIKGTSVVLIFEIKSQKTGIVAALKTALDKFDMYRQVVVISSHSRILTSMSQTLPIVPTARLIAVDESNLEDVLLSCSTTFAGVDAPYGGITPEINEFLRDRGYIGWYWTYDTTEQMSQAIALGYTGLTTNVADEFQASANKSIIKRDEAE